MLHMRSAHSLTMLDPKSLLKWYQTLPSFLLGLSNLARSDSEIIDPDFRRDVRVATLEDLAESPTLLVIRLGVKTARNSAMPEVLAETIELRQHLGKPTWLVVEPEKPLEEGHISWSRAVDDALDGWERIGIVGRSSNTKAKGSLSVQTISGNNNPALPTARHKTMKL